MCTFLLSILSPAGRVLAPLLAALIVTLLATSSEPRAQDAEFPKPAAALAKYEPLLGVWSGTGRVWADAGEEPMNWRATEEYRRVLGDHFVHSQLVVHFDGMPGSLAMVGVHGYEADTDRFVVATCSNAGDVRWTHSRWLDDRRLLMNWSGVQEGRAFVERGLVTVDDGKMHYRSERCHDDGAWFVHVEGRFEKGDVTPAAFPAEAAFMDMPTPAPMQPFDAFVGRWRVDGSMAMAPGAERMPIGATETVKSLFGGSLIVSHVHGDPAPFGTYEGVSWTFWDANDRQYHQYWFDNMGVFSRATGRRHADGDKLVFASTQRLGGQLATDATVVELVDGKPTGVRATSTRDGSEPFVSFESRYAPAKK